MERDLTSGSVWKNIVYFSLPYLLSYFLQTLYGLADLFIVGQLRCEHDGGIHRQSGDAYADGDDRRSGDGNHGKYWSGSGSAGQPKGIESSGKYHRAFRWRLSGSSSRFTGSGAANRACDVHTGGSGRRNGAVSYDLFYRNPVYHRV